VLKNRSITFEYFTDIKHAVQIKDYQQYSYYDTFQEYIEYIQKLMLLHS